MSYSCKICGSEEISGVEEYKGVSRIFLGKTLVKCSLCGVKQLVKMITEEEAKKYNSDYWDKIHHWYNSQTEKKTRWKRRVLAKERAEYLSDWLLIEEEVLEVGSERGFLIEELRKNCSGRRFSSIEYDEGMRKTLVQKNVGCYFTKEEVGRKKFDVIILAHVLEHMVDPRGFLVWARNHLKPFGMVFIDVPSNDDEFRLLHEPHLFVFNEEVMRKMVNNLGFTVLDLKVFGRRNEDIRKDLLSEKRKNRSLKTWLWRVRFLFNKKKALLKYYQAAKEGKDRCWLRVLLEV